MASILELSMKELERVKILSRVVSGDLTQLAGAKILGLTDRQVRNLIKRYLQEGERSCISKKRGKPSNRSLSNKREVLHLVGKYYGDFTPKLASEYLRKNHDINISKETLRHWMTEAHLWFPKNKRHKPSHLPRKRRHCFGELIQVDGSHHDWFEGRGQACVLMVFIDDATSTITSLHFAKTENLEAYYEALYKHLKAYGIPCGIYGDRCSVLCSRNPKESKETTQWQKALKELGCELILAYSPEAKGRVERANRTLQDRLVKMLRLKGINSIEEANEILEAYRLEHNQLFSKKPVETTNAHRPLEGICLEEVLSIRETRTLDKKFTVQFRNTFYLISAQDTQTRLFNKAKLEIRVLRTGQVIGFIKGRRVTMQPLRDVECKVMDEKEIKEWKPKNVYHPPKTHPYKLKFYHHWQQQHTEYPYAV